MPERSSGDFSHVLRGEHGTALIVLEMSQASLPVADGNLGPDGGLDTSWSVRKPRVERP